MSEDGQTRKTRLALKSGLNYNVCLKYIDLLQTIGWVELTRTGDSEHRNVSVTQLGRHMHHRLSHNLEGSHILGVDAESIAELGKQLVKTHGLPDGSATAASSESSLGTSLRKQQPMDLKSLNKRRQEQSSPICARLMLIDDEEDVLFTYQSILTHSGYLVDSFSRPGEALVRFAAEPSSYDLVVMDIRMPQINGLQLYQRMKVINPNTRFIFISALDAAKELISLLPQVSTDDVIQKPVKGSLLIEKVSAAIEKNV